MTKTIVPALVAGVPFGFILGALYSIESSTGVSIAVGIVGGAAAAVAVALYVAWRARRWAAWVQKISEPYAPEGIVHHGYAVAGRSGNAAALAGAATFGVTAALLDAGGVLVLTGERLLFVPHRTNLVGRRIEVPVSDIAGVAPGYGLFPNMLTVHTRSKHRLEFKVSDRRVWLAKLPGLRPGSTRS